jgi:type 1 fimbria pilin
MKQLLNVLGLMVLLCFTLAASSHDGTVNISGNILAASCDVDQASDMQQIYIGDFSASMFSAPGDLSTSKPFNISITGCTSNITGGKVMFSGDADNDNPSLLALSDTTGSGQLAKGVGVEIIDEKQNPVAINNEDSVIYSLKSGDNTLNFYLRYKSTLPVVTAGRASAVMYFDMKYQ